VWCRRRWQNPDKQFKDLPQQLGALNRLYDLLEAHNMRPRFPFPRWQPGELWQLVCPSYRGGCYIFGYCR